MEDVLKKIDLTESEAKLYRTLMMEGEGTASSIANKAGIGRRLAYDKFRSLVDQGLVSYIDKDNKRIYRPNNPEKLREKVRERKKALQRLEKEVESIIPQLMKQFQNSSSEREIRVLEGKDGIKQLFEDQLRESEGEIKIIGSPIEAEDLLEHFLPTWTKRRAEKDIDIEGVFEHEMRGMIGNREATTNARFLPEGHKSNVSISIYGDRAGIIFWLENPLVILIEDREAAESFESYFKLVWEAAEE